MRRKILMVIGSILLCSNAFAAEGRWIEGFGQGNLEYFIDVQGMRLQISCPTQDGSPDLPSSVSLNKISTNTDINKFIIVVGGITYDAPFDAGSRVGMNNFTSLLESLRKGSALVKIGNKSIKFPKSNAAKILPVYGEKGFSCNLI